ncbi:DUF5665 domain-containing protein [Christensenellaceae bacterium OttesenSCG-928-M15]|nr:DUF5665 domain-containing protein [Christensenellaceae bacterium OttesenSCG-928-M15]
MSNGNSNGKNQLKRIEKKLDALAFKLDNAGFQEYVDYTTDKKRMYKNAFRSGLLRGLGTAVGFTLLGALALYILRLLAQSSIPFLGDVIAEIVKIVDSKT